MSRNTIKWIACVTMLCDHIAAAFVQESSPIYFILRMVVGRIAYPVFCTLFIEGFYRTSRPWKHIIDLFIFGCLSEPFYDKALNKVWFYPQAQNVMFAWCLAFLLLILYKKTEQKATSNSIQWCICMLLCFVSMLVARFLSVDYDFAGILAVTVGYFLYKQFNIKGTVIGVSLMITLTCGTPGALLAIPLILFYKPEKKCSRTFITKYGVYAFYPIHLAILALGETL